MSVGDSPAHLLLFCGRGAGAVVSVAFCLATFIQQFGIVSLLYPLLLRELGHGGSGGGQGGRRVWELRIFSFFVIDS